MANLSTSASARSVARNSVGDRLRPVRTSGIIFLTLNERGRYANPLLDFSRTHLQARACARLPLGLVVHYRIHSDSAHRCNHSDLFA
ncbi:BcepGomrgp51 [Burkholderia phage BcepGomr]|uniref:BcepGomrgp51 n=1 Tax=Burkholderia phage BcepGomr TaxID=437329 RepID=UPI0001503504|nr:BcepGomrgp51 [Burkholderia phage BcepGomr]ABP63622.1 BcepGomrgp51 [Burkholderia phage BcepGomr]